MRSEIISELNIKRKKDNNIENVKNIEMEFSESLDPFGHFNNDLFGNLLDEEILQDIFDEIMNDLNFNAMGFDVN